jgi:hypothetical protein
MGDPFLSKRLMMKRKEKINLLNKAKDGNELILIAYAIVVSQTKRK